MKKIFFFIFVFLTFQLHETNEVFYAKKQSTTQNKSSLTKIKKIEDQKMPSSSVLERAPAQLKPSVSRPIQRSEFVKRNNSINLESGEWLTTNIHAISSDLYSPTMGILVFKDKAFSYFDGDAEGATPVAFDPSSQRFYPISQILMLKNINEDLRQEIFNEGHKEYHYQISMKLLYLESSPSEILSLYAEFKNRNIDAHLEVLKETPHSR